MSDTAPMHVPEPHIDADPDPGNEAGGVDAVEDGGTFPPVPPDEPMSAQMAEEDVPEELHRPEAPDTEANIEDPSSEPSA